MVYSSKAVITDFESRLLAKRLSKHQQKKSLTYGLAGAFTFRIIAISAASFLLKRHVVKLLGGGYLLWVAVKHFWDNWRKQKDAQAATLAGETSTPTLVAVASFWPTAVVIELTDVAFAVDSILPPSRSSALRLSSMTLPSRDTPNCGSL